MLIHKVALCAAVALNLWAAGDSSFTQEEFDEHQKQAFQKFMSGLETSNIALLDEAEGMGVRPDKAKIGVESNDGALLITALAYAAIVGSQQCVFDWLIQRDCSVNNQDNANHATPLMFALSAQYGKETPDLNCIRWILGIDGINLSLKDVNGRDALICALQFCPAAWPLIFARKNASPDDTDNIVLSLAQRKLFDAISSNNTTEMEVAFGEGADVNGRMANGLTPLDLAIILNRSKDVFDCLYKYAADFNITTQNMTPLMLALSPAVKSLGGDVWAVWMLESQNGWIENNIPGVAGSTALHSAVAIQHTKAVELLLKNGAKPLHPNEYDTTPWASAVMQEPPNEEVIKAFVTSMKEKNQDYEASINSKNPALTPVIYALVTQNHKLMTILARCGLSLNVAEPSKGFTPLLSALTKKEPDYEMARLLIDLGADINIPAKSGWPAMAYPLCHGRLEDAKYFHTKGARLDVQGTSGMLLMTLVLGKNQYRAADWLYAHAPTEDNYEAIMVPLNTCAQMTQTPPLSFAIGKGMVSLAKRLIDGGANPNELSRTFHPLLHVMVANGGTEEKITFYKLLAPKATMPGMDSHHLKVVAQRLSELLTPDQKAELATWEAENLSEANRNALSTARSSLTPQ